MGASVGVSTGVTVWFSPSADSLPVCCPAWASVDVPSLGASVASAASFAAFRDSISAVFSSIWSSSVSRFSRFSSIWALMTSSAPPLATYSSSRLTFSPICTFRLLMVSFWEETVAFRSEMVCVPASIWARSSASAFSAASVVVFREPSSSVMRAAAAVAEVCSSVISVSDAVAAVSSSSMRVFRPVMVSVWVASCVV